MEKTERLLKLKKNKTISSNITKEQVLGRWRFLDKNKTFILFNSNGTIINGHGWKGRWTISGNRANLYWETPQKSPIAIVFDKNETYQELSNKSRRPIKKEVVVSDNKLKELAIGKWLFSRGGYHIINKNGTTQNKQGEGTWSIENCKIKILINNNNVFLYFDKQTGKPYWTNSKGKISTTFLVNKVKK